MKDNKGKGGEEGLKREGELIYFLPLKRGGGGLLEREGLNRGFTVLSSMTLMLFRVENDQLTCLFCLL